MYLKYCLSADIAICILGFIFFLIMKKRNQASRKNTFILICSSVMAMICASLIPLIADFLVEKFDFSIAESLIISFFFLAIPAMVIFYLLMPVWAKQFKNDKSGSMVGYAEEFSGDKTDKNESPERESEILQAAVAYTGNFETGETDTDIFKIDETGISADNESKIRNELQETEKPYEEELHTEEIHSDSEERNIYEEENLPAEKDVPEKQAEKQDTYENKDVYSEVSVSSPDNQPVIIRLLNIAMDSKINHNYQIAITAYERALTLDPDDELRYLLILDLCSLYKITGNIESIYRLLNSVQCNLLSEDKKEDILRNIKNY
ncbi:MAG: hypothetical protein GX022_09405 [Clostridiaceae bacterium]|nr:hypothetical protein [Clostridiaceae bacterium]